MQAAAAVAAAPWAAAEAASGLHCQPATGWAHASLKYPRIYRLWRCRHDSCTPIIGDAKTKADTQQYDMIRLQKNMSRSEIKP